MSVKTVRRNDSELGLNVVTKDILTVERGVIVQQVNCQGVMGAGLAKKIADKWPEVKESYVSFCKARDPSDLLGKVVFCKVDAGLMVASVFGQIFYGSANRMIYTRYVGLGEGFRLLAASKQRSGLPVYIPYGIGCGLAGGDWHVVSALIEQELPNAVVCKLPGAK